MTRFIESLSAGGTGAAFVLRLALGVTAVWLAAAVAAVLLRRSSAALRHRVWSLGVVAALALPALVALLPEWRVDAIRLPAPPVRVAVSPTALPVAQPMVAEAAASDADAAEAGRFDASPGWHIRPAWSESVGVSGGDAGRRVQPTIAPAPPAETSAPAPRPVRWPAWLVAAWLVPAVWLAARQVVAVMAARRLVGRAARVEGGAGLACLGRTAARLGLGRRPRLVESAEVTSPLCLGTLRPHIVLPAGWGDWPAGQLEAVLTHELAHVARRDVLWQHLARLACAAYWPHPLAWVAAWRMRVERELACDDWVLRGGESSTRYARWLLDVAARLRGPAAPAEAAGVAMYARGGFERRVSALLDPRRRRGPVSRRTAVALTAAAVVLLAVLGTLSPVAPRRAVAAGPLTQPTTAPATQADTAKKTVRVAGLVEDEQSRPAGGVWVMTRIGLRHHLTRTAPDGRFRLDVEGDKIRFLGLHATTTDGRMQALLRREEDVVGDQASHLRLVLKPAREYPVTVADGQGRPVAGAWVEASAEFITAGEATTDADGKALLRMASDLPPQHVLAMKANVGLDYAVFWRRDEVRKDPYRLEPDYRGPLNFVLSGAKSVRVLVVDERQHPLAGATVYPWTFQKPGKGADVNVSGILEMIRTTNALGIAEFPFVPADATSQTIFWTSLDGYSAPKRCVYDPAAGKTELTSNLVRQVRVTGHVIDPDGHPAAGVTVKAEGGGHGRDIFRDETQTTADGRFQIDVSPNMYYMFVAMKDHGVSPPHLQTIFTDPPAEPVQLTLKPATRIYGRLTAGPENAPVSKESVTLLQIDDQSYYKLPKDKQLPGEGPGTNAIQLSIPYHLYSKDDGFYEFYAGPGSFRIDSYPPAGWTHSERFVVTGQKELEVNLHADVLEVVPKVLKGRVVLGDKPSQGVPDATLSGTEMRGSQTYITGSSDREGNFTVQRGKSDFYLSAVADGGKLRGITILKAADETATVALAPATSVSGRLLDDDGVPLADRTIEYGIRVEHQGGAYSHRFGGKAKTGGDGTFVAEGFVPGFTYEMNVVVGFNDDGQPTGWRGMRQVKTTAAGRTDIGDFKLPPERNRQTARDRAAAAYAKKDAISQRLDQAGHIARVSYQNVLVVLSAADRLASKQFHEYWYDLDHPEVYNAIIEYVPVVVDVNVPETGARAWAERAKVAWPEKGFTLAALDPDGRLLGQTTDEPLSAGGKLDRQKLIDFARKYAPALPDAQKLLDEASAQAGREGKHVLLDYSGPACPPCVLLADYLEANRALIDKDFVRVTIDSRFGHGKDVIERLRKDEYSTPWMVVLTPAGKAVVTSDGPKGNVGYPDSDDGRTQWEKMLRAGAKRLTDAEITELVRKTDAKKQ